MTGQGLLTRGAVVRLPPVPMRAHAHTHTRYSQHAKNVGNNSFQYLTFRAAQWPLGHYFASKCTLQVKTETFAWQEKRRCSFLWPFLAARKGTLFQQAGVWCGQGSASHPLREVFSGHPKGRQHQWLSVWLMLAGQVGQDVHALEEET